MAVDIATAERLTDRVATVGVDRPRMMIHSPVTGATIGTVPRCTAADVTAAVTAARAAQRHWRQVPVAERARILLRFHDAVLDRRDELLDLLQMETGKARLSALEEAVDVAMVTRYYARGAARLLRPRRRHGALPGLTLTVEHRRPKGVVGLITPWNYPLTLPVTDAVPALFVDLFGERVRRMRLSREIGYGPDMGSITSAAQLETITTHVRDALDKGASLVAGGHTRSDLGPWFFEPTVLTDVSDGMLLAREETFGPVVAVYPVEDADEAVTRANDSRYGLNADVWTGDAARGRALATRLDFGTVNVNENYTASWGSADAPMGGMKESGVGRRHGREGLLKYTEAQTVATQRLLPIAPPRGVSQAMYARALFAWLRLMRRLPILP